MEIEVCSVNNEAMYNLIVDSNKIDERIEKKSTKALEKMYDNQ